MLFFDMWLKRPNFRVSLHFSPGSADTSKKRWENKSPFNSILTRQLYCQKLPKSVDVRWSCNVLHQCRFLRHCIGICRILYRLPLRARHDCGSLSNFLDQPMTAFSMDKRYTLLVALAALYKSGGTEKKLFRHAKICASLLSLCFGATGSEQNRI